MFASWFFLGACVTSSSVGVTVPLLHAPLTVERTNALVGAVNVVPVRVSNSGTGEARAAVHVTEPLLVPGATYSVPPFEDIIVPVVVRPLSYEPIDGTLELSTGFEVVRVALHIVPATDWDADGYLAIGAGGDDCDDTVAARHPGAAETCDGVDEDCDDLIDNDVTNVPTWFFDDDDDGYGDDSKGTAACTAPAGSTPVGGDCDDGNAAIYPGAQESVPLVDDDCDGRIDENLVAAQDLLFVEIHAAPMAVDASVGQFVEVVNRSARSIDVGGFRVRGTHDSVVLDPHVLAPGDLLLLCASLDPGDNGGIDLCDGGMPQLDRADRLTFAGDQVVDSVDFRSWNVPGGTSIELSTAAQMEARNDSPSDWCSATAPYGTGDLGTPGARGDCP